MRFDASARLALIVAVVTLFVSGIGFRIAVSALNVYLQKEAVPLRGTLSRIPTSLGPWRRVGEDGVLSAAVREALGTDQFLDRIYRIEDGEASGATLSLHLAYYTGMIDAVPHVPERCWGAAGMEMTAQSTVMPIEIDRGGWRETDLINRATKERYWTIDRVDPISRRLETVHMPIGDFALSVTEFQSIANPEQRFIGGYLFIANGRLTPSALGVRSLAFQANERRAYYLKVQFSMGVPSSDESRMDTYLQRASELLSRLLPHIMRQLPDWPSVEAGESSPTGTISDSPGVT